MRNGAAGQIVERARKDAGWMALALIAAIGACGKSSSSPTDGGHPAEAGTPRDAGSDGASIATACGELAQALCAKRMSCSSVNVALVYGDLPTCVARERCPVRTRWPRPAKATRRRWSRRARPPTPLFPAPTTTRTIRPPPATWWGRAPPAPPAPSTASAPATPAPGSRTPSAEPAPPRPPPARPARAPSAATIKSVWTRRCFARPTAPPRLPVAPTCLAATR